MEFVSFVDSSAIFCEYLIPAARFSAFRLMSSSRTSPSTANRRSNIQRPPGDHPLSVYAVCGRHLSGKCPDGALLAVARQQLWLPNPLPKQIQFDPQEWIPFSVDGQRDVEPEAHRRMRESRGRADRWQNRFDYGMSTWNPISNMEHLQSTFARQCWQQILLWLCIHLLTENQICEKVTLTDSLTDCYWDWNLKLSDSVREVADQLGKWLEASHGNSSPQFVSHSFDNRANWLCSGRLSGAIGIQVSMLWDGVSARTRETRWTRSVEIVCVTIRIGIKVQIKEKCCTGAEVTMRVMIGMGIIVDRQSGTSQHLVTSLIYGYRSHISLHIAIYGYRTRIFLGVTIYGYCSHGVAIYGYGIHI